MHGTIALPDQQYDKRDLENLFALACIEARKYFWAYRQLINPKMKKGWWQKLVAAHLQRFYIDMVEGRRPVLLLEAPPQHGKSRQVIDFISWVAGQDPDLATIFASFSDRLGVRTNLSLQRIYAGETFRHVFPKTCITMRPTNKPGEELRNQEIIEYVFHQGSFRNTTVQGPVTGEGLDLGIIDDPIKGRREAQSKTVRDGTWSWLTDDFFTRFSEHAGLLMVMTRWHIDDPAGRMIAEVPDMKVLRFPAIAEEDERYRNKGDPLFPEHKSLEFLMKRKSVMTSSSWESIYQGNPIISGGDLFPIEKVRIVKMVPFKDIKATVRYWDKAGTQGGGAYTAGVLMHALKDGTFIISDVRRGQFSANNRERTIKQTAEIDRVTFGFNMETWVEQEPGSGGKESAENTVRLLAGHSVYADRVTGSKTVRCEPYAAQLQAGNVALVGEAWNRNFLDEHEMFPNGPYRDQVDAAGGAFNKLNKKRTGYDSSMSWL